MQVKIRSLPVWSVIQSGMLAIILLVSACAQSPERNDKKVKKDEVSKPPIIKKPASSFDDTVIVDRESAVFYNPDSVQMEKIKSVNDPGIYATITHDCYYQMQNARNVIRQYWPRIRIIEVVKARYLVFIKLDKSRQCIDLDDKNDICGLFLFDPKKDPELVDMPNVDSFLGFYFGK